MHYIQSITPNSKSIEAAEKTLNGLKSDNLIPFTAKFPDGRLGSVEIHGDTGLAKMILFEDDDHNLAESKEEKRLFGKWSVEYKGNRYTIKVEHAA